MTAEQRVLMSWIPISEKGREVARFLKEEGFDLRHKDVIGHYLSNVFGSDDLTRSQLREIGMILEGY